MDSSGIRGYRDPPFPPFLIVNLFSARERSRYTVSARKAEIRYRCTLQGTRNRARHRSIDRFLIVISEHHDANSSPRQIHANSSTLSRASPRALKGELKEETAGDF